MHGKNRTQSVSQVTLKALPALFIALSLVLPARVFAGVGTEGASFLDIPIGAGPAALGSAYTALATDAYAPTVNPAGLGFVDATSMAAQHLSYVDSINDEYLSLVHPLSTTHDDTAHRGIGLSAQYLGSGDIARTDVDTSGNYIGRNGSFSSHYAAYNASFGQAFGDKLGVGLTGKWINAQIDNISANAYAADLGALYKLTPELNLAGTLTNIGTPLKFISEGDSLPMSFHAAAAYQPNGRLLGTGEVVYSKNGFAAFHMGGQWRPIQPLALRVGYRTDTVKGLGPMAGMSAGVGVTVWGQELAYAWLPYGDLGNTQYFSVVVRFGERSEEKRNLIYYQNIKQHRSVKRTSTSDPEYQQLMQLLFDDDTHVASHKEEGAQTVSSGDEQ